MELTGKETLITGGNSGAGLATARLFVQEGASVAITGRDQKTLDKVVSELGPNVFSYRTDVTDATACKELLARNCEGLRQARHRIRKCRNLVPDAHRVRR